MRRRPLPATQRLNDSPTKVLSNQFCPAGRAGKFVGKHQTDKLEIPGSRPVQPAQWTQVSRCRAIFLYPQRLNGSTPYSTAVPSGIDVQGARSKRATGVETCCRRVSGDHLGWPPTPKKPAVSSVWIHVSSLEKGGPSVWGTADAQFAPWSKQRFPFSRKMRVQIPQGLLNFPITPLGRKTYAHQGITK